MGGKFKRTLFLLAVLAVAVPILNARQNPSVVYVPPPENTAQPAEVQFNSADYVIQDAYRNRQSNLQVQGQGTVATLLPDDLEGSRHQRFVLRLSTGQTLLVAHNIDLAPRINTLSKGDTVKFYGQYEWNEKGGVIHWTHHDPGRRHIDGWLEHKGRFYQ